MKTKYYTRKRKRNPWNKSGKVQLKTLAITNQGKPLPVYLESGELGVIVKVKGSMGHYLNTLLGDWSTGELKGYPYAISLNAGANWTWENPREIIKEIFGMYFGRGKWRP